jgi:Lipocalin-like domain
LKLFAQLSGEQDVQTIFSTSQSDHHPVQDFTCVQATNKFRKMDHEVMKSMNRRTTLTLTALAFLCLGIALPPSDALGQQKTLKELIVGTWILESVYDQTEDGIKHEPWGPGVKGIAMFDGNGHYSWQIMAASRPKSEVTSPRTPVGQVNCFFGTYTVDEAAKLLVGHVERCTFPQWDEIDYGDNIAMPTENELNISSTKPIPDPAMGAFVPHINFKRAK